MKKVLLFFVKEIVIHSTVRKVLQMRLNQQVHLLISPSVNGTLSGLTFSGVSISDITSKMSRLSIFLLNIEAFFAVRCFFISAAIFLAMSLKIEVLMFKIKYKEFVIQGALGFRELLQRA